MSMLTSKMQWANKKKKDDLPILDSVQTWYLSWYSRLDASYPDRPYLLSVLVGNCVPLFKFSNVLLGTLDLNIRRVRLDLSYAMVPQQRYPQRVNLSLPE